MRHRAQQFALARTDVRQCRIERFSQNDCIRYHFPAAAESRREMMRPDETPLAAFHRLNHDYIFPRVAGML